MFLLLAAAFTGYLVFSGYRVLGRKDLRRRGHPTALDWSAAVLGVGASVGLIAYAASEWRPGHVEAALVAGFFGGMLGLLAGSDVYEFLRAPERRQPWVVSHMGKMLGSYVSALTAVSAVQLTTVPDTIRWLWPTADRPLDSPLQAPSRTPPRSGPRARPSRRRRARSERLFLTPRRRRR